MRCITSVNPKSLTVESCVISKCGSSAILNEWLSQSDLKLQSRSIKILENEIFQNMGPGIEVTSEAFSAHNIKFSILRNKIVNNKGDGISMSNLAITDLKIVENDVSHNFASAISLKSVH